MKTTITTSTPICAQCNLYTCRHKNTFQKRVQTLTINKASIEDGKGTIEADNASERAPAINIKYCGNCSASNGWNAIKCVKCKLPLGRQLVSSKQVVIPAEATPLLPSKQVFRWKAVSSGAYIRIYGDASVLSTDSSIVKIGWVYSEKDPDALLAQTIPIEQIKDIHSSTIDDIIWHIDDTKTYKTFIVPSKDDVLLASLPAGDVRCAYCSEVVVEKYLDQHYATHIKNFKPKPAITHKPAERQPDMRPDHRVIDLSRFRKDGTETVKEPIKAPSLKSREDFKFREIVDVSAASSCSADKRFSDVSATFWLNDKQSTYSGHQVGVGWGTSTDFQRIVVLITHDSVDDYYDVSVRLFKRGTYWTSDSIEDATPDKLCCDMPQAMKEIRKALLYFRISPIIALKRLVKMLRAEGDDLVEEIDEEGNLIEVSTSNHHGLMAELEKKQEASKDDDITEHWRGMMEM